jgi:lysyl-tRNA synthetase, class II
MEDENKLVQEKISKLNEIRDIGANPYPYNFEKKDEAKKIQEKYASLAAEEKSDDDIKIAGRIMNLRRMGKATFMHIMDESGKVQIYIRKDDIGEDAYTLLKKSDIGDIIGVIGTIFKTKMGEISVYARSYEILCKSIRPLPEKYHGIKDKELRYRQRYVDLIMNEDVRELFKKRSIMVKAIREFMDKKGFMEVETPLLQTQYGGASARPFVTHINAWNMPMFLSIAPELFLKRLIIAGYEKVYTICKNFRNEGVDASHNPEFTMLEAYQAYADYDDMMQLIEEAYEYAATAVNGTTKVTREINGVATEIDFKAPWERMTTKEAIQKYLDIDVESMTADELKAFCKEQRLEYNEDDSWGKLVLNIFDELVECKIMQPVHIYDRPREGTPLCKIHRKDDRYNEQNEPVGLGMELGNMYSELNDPIRQKELFEEQLLQKEKGDDEAHPMDDDFLNALEIGMPPTGGIGFGIDRMAMLILGAESIRDVIFFPTMKPIKTGHGKTKEE